MSQIIVNHGQPVPRYMNHLFPIRDMVIGDFFVVYPRQRQSLMGLKSAIMVAIQARDTEGRRFTLKIEREAPKGKPVAIRCSCVPPRRKTDQVRVNTPPQRARCPKCKHLINCPECAKDRR